jgi:hypothetical protein
MVTKDSSRALAGHASEPEWEQIKLLYNKPAATLVAQWRRIGADDLPIDELYLRAAGETEYRKVAGGDDQITCWDTVSCGRHPFVIFNAFKMSGMGGDWVSICRVDLPRGNVKNLIDRGKLKAPNNYAAAWVASILDIDDEGRTILCRLALESLRGSDVSVEYFVSEIDVATGDLSLLAPLPNVFG